MIGAWPVLQTLFSVKSRAEEETGGIIRVTRPTRNMGTGPKTQIMLGYERRNGPRLKQN